LIGSCRTLATPSPSITLTAQATKPAQPSMTATVILSRTATVTSTGIRETPTVPPDIASTVIAISSPRIEASFLSPDGKWRGEVILYDCVQADTREDADMNSVEVLRLIRVNDQREMIVEQDLYNCGGIGAYGLAGLFWSSNNQYFYFTDAVKSAPDGLCGYWTRPIKRVNVYNGEVESLDGGPLSPDKTKLAFWRDNEIVIWSLDEGEITHIPGLVPETFNNEIAWSPDGKSLVYLQTDLDCFPFGKSYVTHLDLSGMKQSLLLESETPSFNWLTWDAPYRISLVDDKGTMWRYNLVSQELRPIP
jgi:WD40 repeat protein